MSCIDVWYVPVSGPFDPHYWGLLSNSEKARAERFVFDRHRDEYVTAHALLRLALSRRAAVLPERWQFTAAPNGRPEISGAEARLGLRFSISHTDGLAACAVAHRVAVGIDAEALQRRARLELLYPCLSPGEQASIAALPTAHRGVRFLVHWTLKEALLKATGHGLGVPPEHVAFTLGPGRTIHVALPLEVGAADGWRFATWQRAGCRISLAVHARRRQRVSSPRPWVARATEWPGPTVTRLHHAGHPS